jgi:hypothetical protein
VKYPDQVAPQPTATIDVAFGADAPDEVGDQISHHHPKRSPKRHVAFAENVGRIDDLRVPKSELATLPVFCAKVNSPDAVRPHDPAGTA